MHDSTHLNVNFLLNCNENETEYEQRVWRRVAYGTSLLSVIAWAILIVMCRFGPRQSERKHGFRSTGMLECQVRLSSFAARQLAPTAQQQQQARLPQVSFFSDAPSHTLSCRFSIKLQPSHPKLQPCDLRSRPTKDEMVRR